MLGYNPMTSGGRAAKIKRQGKLEGVVQSYANYRKKAHMEGNKSDGMGSYFAKHFMLMLANKTAEHLLSEPISSVHSTLT